MRKVETTMDGACLFRSLATGLFYREYGINLGGGTYLGEEQTVGDLCHNLLSRWIRMVVTHAMFYPNITTDTIFADKSIKMVLEELYGILQVFGGARSTFQSGREKRQYGRFISRYVPFLGVSEGNFLIGDTPANLLSMSGREEMESHLQYCRRMSHLNEWGGAGECFVFSRIFHYAVSISQGRRTIQKYVPQKIKGIIHIRYSPKYEHYDVMI